MILIMLHLIHYNTKPLYKCTYPYSSLWREATNNGSLSDQLISNWIRYLSAVISLLITAIRGAQPIAMWPDPWLKVILCWSRYVIYARVSKISIKFTTCNSFAFFTSCNFKKPVLHIHEITAVHYFSPSSAMVYAEQLFN